jgi:glycerophosphoryl diester phosphodiesterase
MKQYTVGHRGAAGEAPESTLKAFKIGCESPADVVECDIHLSKDKKLVVFHDSVLYRTSNGTGWVKDFTFEELRKLDAGDGEKIPSLEEVVDLVKSYNKKLVIEIKGEDWPTTEETTKAFAEYISADPTLLEWTFIHSFWHPAVKMIKNLYPKASTWVIMMLGLPPEEMLQLILNANANGASIEKDYISPELVKLTKEKGISLNAWLLNDEDNFKAMKNLGVDGLITNYPNKFHL